MCPPSCWEFSNCTDGVLAGRQTSRDGTGDDHIKLHAYIFHLMLPSLSVSMWRMTSLNFQRLFAPCSTLVIVFHLKLWIT